MKNEKESWILAGSLFLILPYLFSVVILGRSACPVIREPDMEEYVAAAAASQISWDESKETIKAQTVIARTNLFLKKLEGQEGKMLETVGKSFRSREMKDEMLRKYQVFQEAAMETKGEVLKLGGEIRELPYHALSQGKTRDGKEVLGEGYAYLHSAETTKDMDSPLYVEGCYFSFEELEKILQKHYSGFVLGEERTIEVKARDSAEYVMEIQIGNQEFQGEKVREILGLPSSCFTVQTLDEDVRFLCRGRGHGMGMSQYSAEQMALEGKGYEEILKYFFPEMELEEY